MNCNPVELCLRSKNVFKTQPRIHNTQLDSCNIHELFVNRKEYNSIWCEMLNIINKNGDYRNIVPKKLGTRVI